MVDAVAATVLVAGMMSIIMNLLRKGWIFRSLSLRALAGDTFGVAIKTAHGELFSIIGINPPAAAPGKNEGRRSSACPSPDGLCEPPQPVPVGPIISESRQVYQLYGIGRTRIQMHNRCSDPNCA